MVKRDSNSLQITVYQAKTHLSKYLDDIRRGKRVLLGKYGYPEFEIVVFRGDKNKHSVNSKRAFGALKGEIEFSSDYENRDE